MITLNRVWVFLFAALLIVVPWGYAAIALLALGSLVVWVVLNPRRLTCFRSLDKDDIRLCLVLLLFGGLWLLDVARTGHWPVGQGNQGAGLPFWPLFAAALLVSLRLHPITPRVLWAAVSVGALGAGSIALYERLILGHARAANGMNAIPFGNLSLLLGALSLMGALWCLRGPSVQQRVLLVVTLSGGLAGMVGSLLSGTRGGWLAAPLLLWVVYRAARGVLPLKLLNRLAAGVLIVVTVIVVMPQSGVRERVALAVSNVNDYWTQDVRGTSVGLRLEMWRAGGHLFIERPWVGWGEGALEAARDSQVREGAFHSGISRYDQLHSDVIDTAARRGSLGLVTLLLLYGVPIWLFCKRTRVPGAGAEIRLVAAAGMMVSVAFIDFGLTQSMLRDARGLSGYLGLLIICWAVLKQCQPSPPG